MDFFSMFSILQNYKTKNLRIKFYHFLRLSVFPLKPFLSIFHGLRPDSNILSVGCGYATIETILAIRYPMLYFVGCDISASRILAANKATKHIPNLSLYKECVDVIDLSPFSVLICNDILHHLEKTSQIKFLEKISRHNFKEIIVKDVDLFPRWKYIWNYLHDFMVAGPPLNYQSSLFFKEYLEQAGFDVIVTRADVWQPYNHYILRASKVDNVT